jgi:hypothetical protein
VISVDLDGLETDPNKQNNGQGVSSAEGAGGMSASMGIQGSDATSNGNVDNLVARRAALEASEKKAQSDFEFWSLQSQNHGIDYTRPTQKSTGPMIGPPSRAFLEEQQFMERWENMSPWERFQNAERGFSLINRDRIANGLPPLKQLGEAGWDALNSFGLPAAANTNPGLRAVGLKPAATQAKASAAPTNKPPIAPAPVNRPAAAPVKKANTVSYGAGMGTAAEGGGVRGVVFDKVATASSQRLGFFPEDVVIQNGIAIVPIIYMSSVKPGDISAVSNALRENGAMSMAINSGPVINSTLSSRLLNAANKGVEFCGFKVIATSIPDNTFILTKNL